jgi:hypothetical protein
MGASRSESAESWNEQFPELEVEVIKRLMKQHAFANDARLAEIMAKEAANLQFNATDQPFSVEERPPSSQASEQSFAHIPVQ